jgi:hypothetical protein
VGSHVNLTCIVQFSPEPPEYVFWHHHDQVRTKKKNVVSLQSSSHFYLILKNIFLAGIFQMSRICVKIRNVDIFLVGG